MVTQYMIQNLELPFTGISGVLLSVFGIKNEAEAGDGINFKRRDHPRLGGSLGRSVRERR